MTRADWIVIGVLLFLAALAVYYLIRRRKKGGCAGCSDGCSGTCAGCAMQEHCNRKDTPPSVQSSTYPPGP